MRYRIWGIQAIQGVQTGVQLRYLLLFLSAVARETAVTWNPYHPNEVIFRHFVRY